MKKFFTINKSINKKAWEEIQKDGYEGVRADCIVTLKEMTTDDNKFSFVLSTEAVDRHGDIVLQEWDLKNFEKNPVVLDSHSYWSIEQIIGKVSNARVENSKLVGDISFFLENPLGRLAYAGVKGGFINAGSVGFIPFFDEEGNMYGGELLEYSMVSVPANPEALLEKSLSPTLSKDLEAVEKDLKQEEESEKGSGEEVEDVENEQKSTEKTPEKVFVSTKSKIYAKIVNEEKQRREKLKKLAIHLKKVQPLKTKREMYKILRDLL